MPYLLVRHKVADYTKWRPLFDQHAATRRANGAKGGQILRSANNPNEVILLFEWENLEKARQFAQSSNLREIMQQAGVIDQPDIYFFETVENIPV
jgi:heme-degrading monooxygenase HmoA